MRHGPRALTTYFSFLLAGWLALPMQAATVVGILRDVTGGPVAANPLFVPQSTPLASGELTILDVPKSATSTNGAFSIELIGGYYRVSFGPYSKSFYIWVPIDDTNTYTLNQCASLVPTNSVYFTATTVSNLLAQATHVTAGGGLVGVTNGMTTTVLLDTNAVEAIVGAMSLEGVPGVEAGSGLLGDTNGGGVVSMALDPAVTNGLARLTDLEAATNALNAALAAQLQNQSQYGTYIVSGGNVAWESGYSFRVSPTVYYIDGVQYSAAEQTITLDAADGTYDRIDVVGLNASGTVVKIAGTPAENPAAPVVDPSETLAVTFVYVPAGSTAPNVTEVAVYKEGAEWTATASAGTIVVNSTTGPRSGTKCINGTAAAAGAYFTAVSGAAVNLQQLNSLVFYVDPKVAWPGTKRLLLQWYSGSTARGTAVALANGAYGFSSQTGGAYQLVVIPVGMFNVPTGTTVDRIRVTVNGTGANIGFLVDDMVLQAGAGGGQQVTGFRWRGDWTTNVNYVAGDAVGRLGNSYVASEGNVNRAPESSSDVWGRFALLSAPTNFTDYITVVGIGGKTNIWTGPTNALPMDLQKQFYQTYTHCAVTGLTKLKPGFVESVSLYLQNIATTNTTFYPPAGTTGTNRAAATAVTLTTNQWTHLWFEWSDYFTNLIVQGF